MQSGLSIAVYHEVDGFMEETARLPSTLENESLALEQQNLLLLQNIKCWVVYFNTKINKNE